MADVGRRMDLLEVKGFETVELLNAALLPVRNRPLAGVIFNQASIPHDFNFRIRFPAELRSVSLWQTSANPLFNNWQTDLLFPFFQEGGPRNRLSDEGGLPPGYYEELFATLQSAISLSFIAERANDPNLVLPNIVLQRFAHPPTTVDLILELLKVFVSLIFFLSFLYPCINNVKVRAVW